MNTVFGCLTGSRRFMRVSKFTEMVTSRRAFEGGCHGADCARMWRSQAHQNRSDVCLQRPASPLHVLPVCRDSVDGPLAATDQKCLFPRCALVHAEHSRDRHRDKAGSVSWDMLYIARGSKK